MVDVFIPRDRSCCRFLDLHDVLDKVTLNKFALKGTVVVAGRARDIVVGVGSNTAMGSIHDSMLTTEDEATPLKRKLDEFDWVRIGAFCFDSSDAFLMENLICPSKLRKEGTMQNMLYSHGSCILHNIKTGIWIADLQLVQCPVCDLNTFDGTMQVLDARPLELFFTEGIRRVAGSTSWWDLMKGKI